VLLGVLVVLALLRFLRWVLEDDQWKSR
jgi:hypothetical protein